MKTADSNDVIPVYEHVQYATLRKWFATVQETAVGRGFDKPRYDSLTSIMQALGLCTLHNPNL